MRAACARTWTLWRSCGTSNSGRPWNTSTLRTLCSRPAVSTWPWPRAAQICPLASGSYSRSPVRCCGRRRLWSSTRRRAPATRRRTRLCNACCAVAASGAAAKSPSWERLCSRSRTASTPSPSTTACCCSVPRRPAVPRARTRSGTHGPQIPRRCAHWRRSRSATGWSWICQTSASSRGLAGWQARYPCERPCGAPSPEACA
mmetsp:Transcript_68889/g.177497  ORF Transcript_68889/g.177497 Transcript_68889/m.177497 type:complete len:202 (-) Transcript_68889:114-719(-)